MPKQQGSSFLVAADYGKQELKSPWEATHEQYNLLVTQPSSGSRIALDDGFGSFWSVTYTLAKTFSQDALRPVLYGCKPCGV